ncbi:prepilin-type N-terminal cleavage/methylation domain-containing protein [Lentisphaera profundi]|uniref:Prepilin-type N-terminal cleavage/methylation domain-containing protein n=1 Tax=Lentisphaera profundi TaxID=1658616 RepID=A0ABY7VVR0_9BACT|nr:prepilin-type N-terminal cleavage/methylation domain-containing protein [Lentisphaera profundi]WDE96911.1 prepilin-type N-terminal cleavage/methylation domain-containing protein [Lentisphaera profundi]
MKNNCTKTNHFSLIELLVVIAIIGILASFLAPMLSKSRGEARKAVCVSQQKQIGMANFMYLDDNDNRFLPSGMGYNGNNYYRSGGPNGPLPTLLTGPGGTKGYKGIYDYNYVRNMDLWFCPSQNRDFWITSMIWEASFPMNRYLREVSSLSGLGAVSPSEVIFTMDAHGRADIYYNTNVIAPRHVGNKANALFVDGHVKAMNYTYIFSNPQMIGFNQNTNGHPWNRSTNWGIDNFRFDGLTQPTLW